MISLNVWENNNNVGQPIQIKPRRGVLARHQQGGPAVGGRGSSRSGRRSPSRPSSRRRWPAIERLLEKRARGLFPPPGADPRTMRCKKSKKNTHTQNANHGTSIYKKNMQFTKIEKNKKTTTKKASERPPRCTAPRKPAEKCRRFQTVCTE